MQHLLFLNTIFKVEEIEGRKKREGKEKIEG